MHCILQDVIKYVYFVKLVVIEFLNKRNVFSCINISEYAASWLHTGEYFAKHSKLYLFENKRTVHERQKTKEQKEPKALQVVLTWSFAAMQ